MMNLAGVMGARRPQGRQVTMVLRRLGRRLELRSVGLVPEHFERAEGCRAAVAVAVPLAVAVASGQSELGWAVFAAFWTCLCDAPGPDRLRRRLLAVFVGGGALIALAGSWLAALAPTVGLVAGPLLVSLAILAAAPLAHGGLLGTLLAVVAVVAVGFPHPLADALAQSAAFLAGSAWAYLLITVLWRTDPFVPLRRAGDAVIARLFDMAADLVSLGEGPHRDARWHSEHSEHRRAVRLAIERLRGLLARYDAAADRIAPARQALDAAEAVFGALIALDQAFIDRLGSVEERLATAQACRTMVLAWRLVVRTGTRGAAPLAWASARIGRLRVALSEDAFIGCALALEEALKDLLDPPAAAAISAPALPEPKLPLRPAVRQALRQSAGLIAVYYAAAVFQLGYPYWAAMAVIVVLQGGARVTWARCLERILGSLLGGVIALMVLQQGSAPLPLLALAVVLAAAAISLRAVNYTIFVVFLTMLFVLVTEMLHPDVGIASARMLDNVIGSVAALLAVFLFWPDFGAPLKRRLAEGLASNRRYFEVVTAAKPVAEIEAARRAAGLASVEAEVAFHDPGGIVHRLRNREADFAILQDTRYLAGRAAIARHRLLAGARASST